MAKVKFHLKPQCDICGYEGRLHETIKHMSFSPKHTRTVIGSSAIDELQLTCPICGTQFTMGPYRDKDKNV